MIIFIRRHKTQFAALTILFISLSLSNLTSAAEPWPEGETFGDWTARCRYDEAPIVTCVMTQVATAGSSGERLMRINIFNKVNGPTTTNSIQVTLPLGISLINPPQLYVDDSLQRDTPISVCLADGCYSTFDLEPNLLEEILGMQQGRILLKAGNGELTELPISGTGSRAAYNSMLTNARILLDE